MAQFSYSPFATACAAPLSPHAGTALVQIYKLIFGFPKAPPLAGELAVSDSEQTEGEQLGKLSSFEPFPFLT